jgi:hypothetical protein
VDLNASSENSAQLRLTGSQQQIHGALVEKGQELADLYETALRIYWDGQLPARLIPAAHSLRQLVDGLPQAMDVPIPVDPVQITDQANMLEPIWSNALKSGCHQNGEWAGTIDAPLQKLLRKLRGFFEWLEANRPKWDTVIIQMFRVTDPSGQPLPETLEQKRAKAWKELRRYFSNTAHGESTTSEDFATKMEALERILLDSLCRKPSEDLSAIDRILEEGAGDA